MRKTGGCGSGQARANVKNNKERRWKKHSFVSSVWFLKYRLLCKLYGCQNSTVHCNVLVSSAIDFPRTSYPRPDLVLTFSHRRNILILLFRIYKFSIAVGSLSLCWYFCVSLSIVASDGWWEMPCRALNSVESLESCCFHTTCLKANRKAHK